MFFLLGLILTFKCVAYNVDLKLNNSKFILNGTLIPGNEKYFESYVKEGHLIRQTSFWNDCYVVGGSFTVYNRTHNTQDAGCRKRFVETVQGSPDEFGPEVSPYEGIRSNPVGFREAYFKADTTIKKGIVLGSYWTEGFYHFIFEALTRLGDVPKHILDDPEYYIIISTPNFGNNIYTYFELLNIPRERIIRLNHRGVIKADTLLYISNELCGLPLPDRIAELRYRFLDSGGSEIGEVKMDLVLEVQEKKVGILVQRTGSRSIHQFDILVSVLRKQFPEIEWVVFKGSESAREVRQMWSGATYVIAPHGAGLSNMIFSTNLTILEFLPKSYVNYVYERIADVMGHKWYGLQIDNVYGNHQMRISPMDVVNIFELILSLSRT